MKINNVNNLPVCNANGFYRYINMYGLFAIIILLHCIGHLETKPHFGPIQHYIPQTFNVYTSAKEYEVGFKEAMLAKENGDRYHYFVGDDGIISIIDDQDPINIRLISSYLKDPNNNTFLLFTRLNPIMPQTLIFGQSKTIVRSNFSPKKMTVILVHGWRGSGTNEMNTLLTEALLKKDDVNVIVFDWSSLANNCNYNTAKESTTAVGEQLGIFINYLVANGLSSYRRIHLIGFSLGAHLVGSAGRTTGGAVARITGLDPAGPEWYNDKRRLRPSDAKYVEVIHTNTKLFGYWSAWGLGYFYPCGHADFYPNGGGTMVGCYMTNICSHSAAYQYMASSILHNHFKARKCNSYDEVENDECTGPVLYMGNNNINKHGSGLYRVNTKIDYPYR